MGTDPTYETLSTRQLTLKDVIARSIGFRGPVFASAFVIATVAGASFTGKGAGIAVPVSIILAAIGMLGVAWIISRYSRRIHAAGSLYDYVTEAFRRLAGFLAGWVYYCGMTALTLAIGLAFGGFLSSTLADTVGVVIAWYWLAIAFWIVAFFMQYIGVQVSTRAQLVLALGSMVIIGGFAIYIILVGGGGADPDIGSTRFGELTEWLITIDTAAVALGTATGSSRGISPWPVTGGCRRCSPPSIPRTRRRGCRPSSPRSARSSWASSSTPRRPRAQRPATDPGEWFGFFQWSEAFGGFCLVLVYLAISLSGFKGQPGENRIALAVAGVVGTIAMVAAIDGVVEGAPALWRLDRVWWIALLWIALGVVALLLLQARGAFAVKTAAETRAPSN